ncbi:MAG: hypothetical protein HZB42_09750 [Sphingobacteriales bacterium]|nr:hypothetical protein [Sphingobacteriales bacterium]
MNINRHNYEEYFILYMDNELGSEDRRMVEAFVQQHPDLKEELDILLQYKLSPDTSVVFPDKEELMKVNGDTPVTLSNYEEWLLLYVDDELTPGQKETVEKFISANPVVKEELGLLMKTKLHPEEIVFTGKASLYRTEEKVRPLPVRWWRLAAAAVLILALGITGLLIFNKKPATENNGVAKSSGGNNNNNAPVINTIPKNESNDAIIPQQQNTTDKGSVVNNTVKQSFDLSVKQDNKNVAVKNNTTPVNDKLPANLLVPIKKQDEVVADNNNKPSNNLPQPLYNPNVVKTDAASEVVADANIPKEIANPTKETSAQDPVTNVIHASYNNNNGEQLEEGGKNKKNRGIFRKLARTFEKRTNMSATDGDRLLVGGLSIKLK